MGAGELGDAVGESVATGGRVGDAVTGESDGPAVIGGSVGESVHPFPLHFVGGVVDGL